MQQILQCLFKVAHEQARETTPSNKEIASDQEAKSKKTINLVKNRGGCTPRHNKIKDQGGIWTKLGCKNFKVFSFLCRRDVAKACFYSTLNLRRANSCSSRQQQQQQQHMMMIRSMKMKKLEERHMDSAAPAGNKVLPVTDTPLSTSNGRIKPDKVIKGDKSKAMSRMKELLRWAAAAKSEKGRKFTIGRKVMHMRNPGSLKAAVTGDDDQLSLESPKISFRWEVESSYCTSTCSRISMASSSKNDTSLHSTPINDINYCAARKGNWITTDSEFVVLEL